MTLRVIVRDFCEARLGVAVKGLSEKVESCRERKFFS